MSGFKDNIISILRDNMMLHAEAMGLILGGFDEGTAELLKDLQDRKFPVTDHVEKHVFLFDYVIIPSYFNNSAKLLKALSLIGKLSIIIIDITDIAEYYNSRYVSIFGDFTAQKVKYLDRSYLVIKNGADYGN